MDQYVTGTTIRKLREKNRMTQQQLADRLGVSDKEHYISYAAAVSSDDMQLHKFYPEGNAEARFKIRGVKKIFFYCNRDGLFFTNVVKGIDDKESGYDDYRERRELEKAAKMLFG